MNIYFDVYENYKKKNKILFSRNSPSLQDLLELIRLQNHRTLVKWAFFLIDEILKKIKPEILEDMIIINAINLCSNWAKGFVKMGVAKRALLEVHAKTKEINDLVSIALLHAIGQGLATIHVETHAIGLVVYELTSIVLDKGIDNFAREVDKQIEKYENLLKKKSSSDDKDEIWASFLLDDSKPNKEKLLYEKTLKNRIRGIYIPPLVRNDNVIS